MATPTAQASGYLLPALAGKKLAWFDATIIQKAATSDFGATEVIAHPGEEPPMHVHQNEDEYFYVIDGEVTFHCGGESRLGNKGAFIFFPRHVPHTFTVESSSAHFLVLNTPGGFERMFEFAPRTPEEAAKAMNAVGIEIVGPNPRELRAA